jgi:hypothetical protein
LEEFFGVLCAKGILIHALSGVHSHLWHLTSCRGYSSDFSSWVKGSGITVIVAKDECVNSTKSKQVEKVPGDRRYPGNIQIRCIHTRLQHTLKPNRQRER